MKTEPEIKGFSDKNLWRMKPFDEAYKNSPKLSPMVREMDWSHYMIIFSGYKTSDRQEFYLKITKQKGYNKKESEQQLSASLFKGRAAARKT